MINIVVPRNMPATRNECEVFNDKYELIKSLGKGWTSEVFLAREINNPNNELAVKIYEDDFIYKHGGSKEVHKEVEILRSLRHPNIIQIKNNGANGTIRYQGNIQRNLLYTSLEYVSGGCLFDICQKHGPMDESVAHFFASQLVDALSYMHSSGVVHLDIKPENILCDENFNLKVADFGIATNKNIKKLSFFRGTKSYMAPEIWDTKVYDGRQADVFSLGVVIYLILFAKFPFVKASKDDTSYCHIHKRQALTFWRKADKHLDISPELKDLLNQMFEANPAKRPSIAKIKHHPWMRQALDHESIRQMLIDRTTKKGSRMRSSSQQAFKSPKSKAPEEKKEKVVVQKKAVKTKKKVVVAPQVNGPSPQVVKPGEEQNHWRKTLLSSNMKK